MSDLETDFTSAVKAVSALGADQDPGNDVKLRLYALYKQATIGDVDGKRPGFTNPVGRAKHDAWASVSGMSSAEAKRAYVDLAADLIR
ncbi:acyl-CoA-binding protein [Actinopolymorpha singaporensis]|uniref:Acyl-CoA-binding protein n=1 Tax=Actinopolymorpha singaporensis TaxID=117157 RepID=A0A1H1MCW7_9ACTN|nr:acyl-CoA-binding protein [Actinopolymorpha singaporensis]SDR84517.1 Acyl-CoA-binding protein [Actinopolymorpha singaporensis]